MDEKTIWHELAMLKISTLDIPKLSSKQILFAYMDTYHDLEAAQKDYVKAHPLVHPRGT